MIAQHSSHSNEFYTPEWVVEPARTLMGGVELDPASSWLANQVVRAERYGGWIRDGSFVDAWDADWRARSVFLNPPGGRATPEMRRRVASTSSAACWWAKLAAAWERGDVGEALFVGFTLEILSTSQGQSYLWDPDTEDEENAVTVPSCMAFPFCVPHRRISFDAPSQFAVQNQTLAGPHPTATRVATRSATHANVVVYLPPKGDAGRVKTDHFVELFSELGAVKV